MLDPAEAIEKLRAATARVEQQTAGLVAEREKRQVALSEAKQKYADERRKGEHGQEWQVLQQRIDIGQTSEFDIVQGLDLSVEARAVRKQMGITLGRVADERAADGEGPAQLPVEFEEAQQRLVATMRRLRDLSTPGA